MTSLNSDILQATKDAGVIAGLTIMRIIKEATAVAIVYGMDEKEGEKDVRAVQKLRREVKKAKRSLSAAHQIRAEVDSLFKEEDFSGTLTEAKFEELNRNLFKGTIEPILRSL